MRQLLTYWPPRMRIGEMDLPIVAVIDVGQRRSNTSFRHHRVRFAEQRFANHAHADTPAAEASMAALSPAPPEPMTNTSCSWVSY